MKSGADEHEQKGVSTPSAAASGYRQIWFLPARIVRVFSGLNQLRSTPVTKDAAREQQQALRHIVDEECDGLTGMAVASDREKRRRPFGE
jgi:hypothetical protein